MEIKKLTSRPEPNKLPDFPLPFYVRSTGFHEAECGWTEKSSGRNKPFVEVFWTIKGSGEFILPNGKIIAGDGDFCYRLPGEEHLHRALENGWSYFWFTFDGPRAEDFMLAYNYSREVYHAGKCPVHLFNEIELLLRERTPYAQRHAISVATEILALAGKKISNNSKSNIVEKFLNDVQQSDTYLRKNVDDYARNFGVHRTTFNRLFQQEMGTTPGDYLQQLRIQCALSLLCETEMSVKEIAYTCGIMHTSYFCRLIRKVTGLTPAKYRKQNLS